MILKNYWRWLCAEQTYGAQEPEIRNAGLIKTSGESTVILVGNKDSNSYSYQNTDFSEQLFVGFDSGDTAPTADDYALENDITSSFSDITCSYAASVSDVFRKTFTITATNTTSTPLTIKKIGIGKGFLYEYNMNYANCLLAIVELSNPITVAAGDSFTVVCEWTES